MEINNNNNNSKILKAKRNINDRVYSKHDNIL